MHLSILVVLLLNVPVTIQTTTHSWISAGAKIAPPHIYPWMLNLHLDKSTHPQKFSCGASLIRRNHNKNESDLAISAAHCFDECKTSKKELTETELIGYTIYAGKHSLNKTELGQEQRALSHVRCHKNYKLVPTFDGRGMAEITHDIAIIKLQTPVKFSKIIYPINLPKADEEIPKDTVCILAGWGAIDETNSQKYPVVLYHANLTIEEDKTCANLFGNARFDAENNICAGSTSHRTNDDIGRAVACKGDSGGPLMCKNENKKPIIAGIVSFGANCDVKANRGRFVPNIFTKVSAYHQWIQDAIRDM